MQEISFLTDTDNQIINKIKELFNESKGIKCAVAFWGDGAPEQLGLVDKNGLIDKKKDVKIICNLASGASNPNVIEMLMDKYPGRIKTYDKLHAKVYLSERGAIVGSANASANGLNYEGLENQGWIEAGLFIHEEGILKDIENWFNIIWEQSKDITDKQIKEAKVNWLKRRKTRIMQNGKSNSLLINLRDHPERFKDKDIYFAIWSKIASEDALIKMNELKESIEIKIPGIPNTKLDFWEDWEDFPEHSKFIDIFYDGKKIEFGGFREMPEKKIIISIKDGSKGSINLCYKIKDIDGLKLSPNDRYLIEERIDLLFEQCKKEKDGGYLPLLDARSILFS